MEKTMKTGLAAAVVALLLALSMMGPSLPKAWAAGGDTTTSSTTLDVTNLPDGTYTVPVTLKQLLNLSNNSMGAAALQSPATLTVSGGNYTLALDMSGIVHVATIEGHCTYLGYYTSYTVGDSAITVDSSTLVDAATFNASDATKVANVPVNATGKSTGYVAVAIRADAMGDSTEPAAVQIDWDNIQANETPTTPDTPVTPDNPDTPDTPDTPSTDVTNLPDGTYTVPVTLKQLLNLSNNSMGAAALQSPATLTVSGGNYTLALDMSGIVHVATIEGHCTYLGYYTSYTVGDSAITVDSSTLVDAATFNASDATKVANVPVNATGKSTGYVAVAIRADAMGDSTEPAAVQIDWDNIQAVHTAADLVVGHAYSVPATFDQPGTTTPLETATNYFSNTARVVPQSDGTYQVTLTTNSPDQVSQVRYNNTTANVVKSSTDSATGTFTITVPSSVINGAVAFNMYVNDAWTPVDLHLDFNNFTDQGVVPDKPDTPVTPDNPDDNSAANLVVGHAYSVPATFDRTGTTTTSSAASYFSDTARVAPQSDGSYQVTLTTNSPDQVDQVRYNGTTVDVVKSGTDSTTGTFTITVPSSAISGAIPVDMHVVPMAQYNDGWTSADLHLTFANATDLGEIKNDSHDSDQHNTDTDKHNTDNTDNNNSGTDQNNGGTDQNNANTNQNNQGSDQNNTGTDQNNAGTTPQNANSDSNGQSSDPTTTTASENASGTSETASSGQTPQTSDGLLATGATIVILGSIAAVVAGMAYNRHKEQDALNSALHSNKR